MKAIFKVSILSFLALMMTSLTASGMTAVNVKQCNQMIGKKEPFLLTLKRGQPLIESITSCAIQAQLAGASLSGIGAVENPILAYHNFDTKKYQYKNYRGIYELVSLDGTISMINGKQKPHIHTAISNDQYDVFGGHLNEAFVAAYAEITIVPFQKALIRKYDNAMGMDLIVPN